MIFAFMWNTLHTTLELEKKNGCSCKKKRLAALKYFCDNMAPDLNNFFFTVKKRLQLQHAYICSFIEVVCCDMRKTLNF